MPFTQSVFITGTGFQSELFDASPAPAPVSVDAAAGNDGIIATAYDDVLWGGLGNDMISSGGGNDFVFGDEYADSFNGDGSDSIDAGAGNDVVYAAGGADLVAAGAGFDTVYGGAGNDDLWGGTGIDKLYGGDGNDWLFGTSAAVSVQKTLAYGYEGVYGTPVPPGTTAAFTFAAETDDGASDVLDGGAGNDVLTGQGGADTLIGGEGNDALDGGAGNDTLKGGTGDDTYYVHDAGDVVTEEAGEGFDTLIALTSYALKATSEVELIRTASFFQATAIDLTGSDTANTILGNAGVNVLKGLGGNDVLDGKAGADVMDGGQGDDEFYVDESGDQVIEAAGEGFDMILANASFTLSSTASIEILSAYNAIASLGLAFTGNDFGQTIIGDAGANALKGLGGNDVLDGRTGADAMEGGLGDDLFYVDDAGDAAIELAGEGFDTVLASVGFALGVGASVEVLATADAAAGLGLALTGNDLAQSITGDAGANLLKGLGGDDILDGKAGADVMEGGQGNDVFLVDNAGDTVIEVTGGGVDTVRASAHYTLASAASVEVLSAFDAASTAGLALTGNNLAQTMQGNAGANTLKGLGGNDILSGLDGHDRLEGGLGNDKLNGGAGNDKLLGGQGLDTLTGGLGRDTFIFNTKAGSANLDKITDFKAIDDTIFLDNAAFAGIGAGTELAPGKLAASLFHLGAAAHDADDRIIYDKASGSLYYDADGTGATAQVKIAVMTNKAAVTLADFMVI